MTNIINNNYQKSKLLEESMEKWNQYQTYSKYQTFRRSFMRYFSTINRLRGLLIIGLLSLVIGAGTASAQLSVDLDDGDDVGDCIAAPCLTIGYAVSVAAPGDTIELSEGDFNNPGDYGLDIGIELTIRGQGVDLTTIDAQGEDRHFTILGGAEVTLQNLTLRNGVTDTSGGAIEVENDGVLNVINCKLQDNEADDDGGAIYSYEGTVFIKNTELENNKTINGSGGAIEHFNGTSDTESLTIVDSTLSNNSSDVNGGALVLDGIGNIIRSTFSDNNAEGNGGAVQIAGGELVMFNSTLSVNSANFGGGLWVTTTAPVAVYSCTFVGNIGTVGAGAISGSGPNVDLRNTIITQSEGDDCEGGYLAGNRNLLDDENNICAPVGSGVNWGKVTGIGDLLQDNGGPTKTYALQAGSNAINVGFGGCVSPGGGLLPLDQRGFPRDVSVSSGCDIGAFERQ